MFRNHLLLYLFGISNCFVAVIVAHEAINGGYIVRTDHSFPYQISLWVHGHNSICGGGLFSTTHVLTAARCVVGNDHQFINVPISIIAGTRDLRRTTPAALVAQVQKVYVPEEFFQSVHSNPIGDIAVLMTLDNVLLHHHMGMYSWIRLPSQFIDRTIYDKIADIAGYGRGQHLLYAQARILNHDLCQNIHHPRRITELFTVCAKVKHESGSKLRGVCHGDEGSPLVRDGYVIGILSEIAEDCDEMPSSAIYTRVSGFRTFIELASNDRNDEHIRTHVLPIN